MIYGKIIVQIKRLCSFLAILLISVGCTNQSTIVKIVYVEPSPARTAAPLQRSAEPSSVISDPFIPSEATEPSDYSQEAEIIADISNSDTADPALPSSLPTLPPPVVLTPVPTPFPTPTLTQASLPTPTPKPSTEIMSAPSPTEDPAIFRANQEILLQLEQAHDKRIQEIQNNYQLQIKSAEEMKAHLESAFAAAGPEDQAEIQAEIISITSELEGLMQARDAEIQRENKDYAAQRALYE